MTVVTEDQLVEKLQGLGLSFQEYKHEALMTCADFSKTDIPSTVSICKNMLLKDKKNRLILVTALDTSKVDLKVLSVRLGLGKSGLRMAPDEMLTDILKVPLGSVTPFALVQPTASDVVLLLDEKLKGASALALHPLINTATLAIPPAGLEAFVGSLGRAPFYVDFEAEPVINAENPPDLKSLVDGAAPYASADPAGAPPEASGEQQGKGGKKDKKKAAAGAAAAPKQPAKDYSNVNKMVQDCIGMVMGAVEVSELPAEKRRQLEADLAVKLGAMKNSAYTNGWRSARGAMLDSLKM